LHPRHGDSDIAAAIHIQRAGVVAARFGGKSPWPVSPGLASILVSSCRVYHCFQRARSAVDAGIILKASSVIRFAITAVVVIAAGTGAWLLWEHYMYAPWTRDARVRADVVNVT